VPSGVYRLPIDVKQWKQGKYISHEVTRTIYWLWRAKYNELLESRRLEEFKECLEIEYYSIHGTRLCNELYIDIPGINDWMYVYCK